MYQHGFRGKQCRDTVLQVHCWRNSRRAIDSDVRRGQSGGLHAQLSISESRISPMTAADVWPWSSGGEVRKGQGTMRPGLTERGLNDADFGRGGIEASESTPVVHDKAGTNDIGSSIHCSCLSQRVEFCYRKRTRTSRTTRGTWSKLLSSS
jgi:hypothetical protein